MTIRVGIYDNQFQDIFPENQINDHGAYHIVRFFSFDFITAWHQWCIKFVILLEYDILHWTATGDEGHTFVVKNVFTQYYNNFFYTYYVFIIPIELIKETINSFQFIYHCDHW